MLCRITSSMGLGRPSQQQKGVMNGRAADTHCLALVVGHGREISFDRSPRRDNGEGGESLCDRRNHDRRVRDRLNMAVGCDRWACVQFVVSTIAGPASRRNVPLARSPVPATFCLIRRDRLTFGVWMP